jgi:carbon monoxide dehydrogenase subunit G
MELNGSRTVPAPRETVWMALLDPASLRASIPGCEMFEALGDGAYRNTMAARIGPISTRFNGKMRVTDVNPPSCYTIHFEGTGPSAGVVIGKAVVTLESTPDGTTVRYSATAQISGKIAQIGSRLTDAAARKLTDDFFERFISVAHPPEAALPADSPVEIPASKRRWWHGILALFRRVKQSGQPRR